MFTPLSDRVLIKPDAGPSVSQAGLHLVQDRVPEQCGTVVAVGRGRHPLKDVAFDLAAKLDRCVNGAYLSFIAVDVINDAAQMLRDLTGKEPDVKVGDYVIFSTHVGHEIYVNHGHDRYLLMRESDILAVVDPEGTPV